MWAFATDQPWYFRSLVGALFGAILLGGLPVLYNWAKEKGALSESQPAQTPKPEQSSNKPWIEITRDSSADLKGAVIVGTAPFSGSFAKIDDHSTLNAPGILMVGPDAPSSFPMPGPKLQALSTPELLKLVDQLVIDLRQLQKEYDQHLDRRGGLSSREEEVERSNNNRKVFEHYADIYNQKYRNQALALSSAMIKLLGGNVDADKTQQQEQAGAQVILHGFAGAEPAANAAAFLEFLAKKLSP